MQETFRKTPTIKIAQFLTEQSKVDTHDESFYLALKEMSRRQALRINLPLTPEQRNDLAHDVASNIYIRMQSCKNSNFVVSNWIKYVFNLTYRTGIAIYPNGHCRVQTFEVNDLVNNHAFLETYFSNPLSYYKDIMKGEFFISVGEFGNVVRKLTESLCRYDPGSRIGAAVISSVLMGLVYDKNIALFGLEPPDIEYTRVLRNIVKLKLPQAFKDSLLTYNPLLRDYENKIKDYNVFESYKESDETY